MNCPKCGSNVEEGRTVCFMCGANLGGNNPQMPMNNGNDIINSTLQESLNSSMGNSNANVGNSFSSFGNNMNNDSAGGFSTGGFSTGAQPSAPMQQPTYTQPVQNYNPNDYKNAEVKMLAGEEEDIFDFYARNKGWIKVVLFLLLFALVGFIGYKIYLNKITPDAKEPLIGRLYYEVPSGFKETNKNQNSVTYAKSGDKGNDCAIEILFSTDTSGEHVEEFQNEYINKLKNKIELDDEGNVKDPLKEFTTQTNNFDINDNNWYIMNIFYRKSLNADYTLLKYQLLMATHDGRFYDVVLINNSGANACGTALDLFTKSLHIIPEGE